MRKPHYLKSNANGEQPQEVIFYDTETVSTPTGDNREELSLLFGWLAYVRRNPSGEWGKPKWHRFDTTEGFWRYIYLRSRPKTRLYIFSHNQSFDFTVVHGFKTMQERGWEITKNVIEGPPTIISFRQRTSTITVLDTLNYFRQSLKELGKSVGLEKLSYEDYTAHKINPDDYCRRDVEIIMYAMLKFWAFIADNNLGNYQPTLASQAFTAYRHRFMSHRIFIDSNEKALRIARQAYSGGRTEAYFIGKLRERHWLLDINSQYPAVMQTNEYPAKLVGYYKRPSIAEIISCLGKYAVIADVSLDTDKTFYPTRLDGRLIFPLGKFRTCLAGPELSLAFKNSHVTTCWSMAVYERQPLFTEFVNFVYEKRLEYKLAGDTAFAYMTKILGNSLYGKWGQTGRVYEPIGYTKDGRAKTWIELDYKTGKQIHYRQFNNQISVLAESQESRESHPAIASYVTSYARISLLEYKEKAGTKNVVYVDTDSLVVNARGFRRLAPCIDANKLGALKVEYEINDGIIHGVKDYELAGHVKHKGVRASAWQFDTDKWLQPTFVGFRGMLQRGDLDRQLVISTIKHLRRAYKKGTVLANGEVRPFVLDNLKGGI
jgi:DNA polymerase elongation subunit (family B)